MPRMTLTGFADFEFFRGHLGSMSSAPIVAASPTRVVLAGGGSDYVIRGTGLTTGVVNGERVLTGGTITSLTIDGRGGPDDYLISGLSLSAASLASAMSAGTAFRLFQAMDWRIDDQGYADSIDCSGFTGTIISYLGDGPADAVGGAGDDRFYGGSNYDWLSGGDGDDRLFGGAGDDRLWGGDGDDLLDGGEGQGTLYGEAGNDRIVQGAGHSDGYGGAGQDALYAGTFGLPGTLYGGDGTDWFHASASGGAAFHGDADGDFGYGGSNGDLMYGGGGTDTLKGRAGFDRLYGGDRSDALSGGAGWDTLFGDAGNDTIDGGDDADAIEGGGGDDSLRGASGHDTLRGGGGNDVLAGGDGRDTLTGGGGNDRFDFNRPSNNADLVVDFGNAAGNDDWVRIDAAGFGGGLTAGHGLAASQFRSRGDNIAQDADDRFIFRTTDATLWFDVDGNGGTRAVLVADLQAAAVVTSSDILLI